jgi:Phosphotransferase enzyme family
MSPSRISDIWWGMKNVFPEERESIQKFIQSLNLDWLQSRVCALRGGSEQCVSRRDVFSSGQDHLVFELDFTNSTPWIVRISKPPMPDYTGHNPHRGPAEMLSELGTIEYVCQHTSIPIPRIHDYNVESSNPLGAPYMLMDEVQGRSVQHLTRIPEQYKRHVYRQIAKIVLQLHKIQFPLIGLPRRQKDSSRLYIKGAIFEGYKRVDAFSSAREYYLSRASPFSSSGEIRFLPTMIGLSWRGCTSKQSRYMSSRNRFRALSLVSSGPT